MTEVKERLTRAQLAGARLKQMRRLQSLTLKTVAETIGCSESMLSKIETGRVSPSLHLLARLAEALGTTVAAVFQDEASVPVVTYRDGERPVMRLGSSCDGGELTYLERLIPAAEGRLLNA